jgi:hypothetical protein
VKKGYFHEKKPQGTEERVKAQAFPLHEWTEKLEFAGGLNLGF